MRPELSEQLKNVKIDPHEYGKMPMREDVLTFGLKKLPSGEFESDKDILKQWGKLNMIRKNLKVINKYLQTNQGEKLNEWINVNNNAGISKIVLEKIGNHNNETGGISMYFLNLQKFYDEQEKIYDDMEAKTTILPDSKNVFDKNREERTHKRKTRAEVRKIKTKDLKKNGKGFLVVELEEPTLASNAETKNEPQPKEGETKIAEQIVPKAKKKIGVWLAGALITITAISVIVSLNKKSS